MTNGTVVFEVAKHLLHATSEPSKIGTPTNPNTISLVFFTGSGLNKDNHGRKEMVENGQDIGILAPRSLVQIPSTSICHQTDISVPTFRFQLPSTRVDDTNLSASRSQVQIPSTSSHNDIGLSIARYQAQIPSKANRQDIPIPRSSVVKVKAINFDSKISFSNPQVPGSNPLNIR